jgi:hypothetical protein
MPKKRNRPAFAEAVEALPAPDADDGPMVPSPATARRLTDADGTPWVLRRGPLDARLARRLTRSADAMVLGRNAGLELVPVEPGDRAAIWADLADRLDAETLPAYAAYEFTSDDGGTLLYIEESC